MTSTRRDFLRNAAAASAALPSIGARALDAPPSRRGPHHTPKAKRLLILTQSGGPSQLELFDPKPVLKKWEGKLVPDSVRRGQRVTGMTRNQKQLLMGARAGFLRHGEAGTPIGEWLPHMAEIADEFCVVRSMTNREINHAPAMTFMLTGHAQPGRPSIGAWVSYGLEPLNRDLPSYFALISKMRRPSDQPLYEYYWGAGFLPSTHQGVKLRSGAEPILYLQDPPGVSRRVRRAMLDGVRALNDHRARLVRDPEIDARTAQYEMAYRMQASAPDVTDLSSEPDSIFEEYGPDARRRGSYASNCILARRLLERDVRCVQLFHPDWDQHSKLTAWCPARCRNTDQPTAALIRDLKRRGLLDDTVVLWGGEFGRSPVGQGNYKSPEAGRDHHGNAFSVLLAGAGIRNGHIYGATDDFGYNVVEGRMTAHDLQATLLDVLGLDHERLTYRYQGRDFRLTDVHGRVVREILA